MSGHTPSEFAHDTFIATNRSTLKDVPLVVAQLSLRPDIEHTATYISASFSTNEPVIEATENGTPTTDPEILARLLHTGLYRMNNLSGIAGRRSGEAEGDVSVKPIQNFRSGELHVLDPDAETRIQVTKVLGTPVVKKAAEYQLRQFDGPLSRVITVVYVGEEPVSVRAEICSRAEAEEYDLWTKVFYQHIGLLDYALDGGIDQVDSLDRSLARIKISVLQSTNNLSLRGELPRIKQRALAAAEANSLDRQWGDLLGLPSPSQLQDITEKIAAFASER